MCQICVDNGEISQATYDKIEAFNAKYDEAQFGPAHIVLADCNIEDEHLQWCIGLIEAALSKNPLDLYEPSKDFTFMQEMDWYKDENPETLKATLIFLEELLIISEKDR